MSGETIIILLAVAAILFIVEATRRDRAARYAQLRVRVENVSSPDDPKPGDRKYSHFFDSVVELVVYTSDNNYLFRVLDKRNSYYGRLMHNQKPWSVLEPLP